jgi:uncharacterized membrane protein YciS (DUF1049 family)
VLVLVFAFVVVVVVVVVVVLVVALGSPNEQFQFFAMNHMKVGRLFTESYVDWVM